MARLRRQLNCAVSVTDGSTLPGPGPHPTVSLVVSAEREPESALRSDLPRLLRGFLPLSLEEAPAVYAAGRPGFTLTSIPCWTPHAAPWGKDSHLSPAQSPRGEG